MLVVIIIITLEFAFYQLCELEQVILPLVFFSLLAFTMCQLLKIILGIK